MERLGKKKSGRDKKEGGRFGLCPNSVSVIVTGKGAGTGYSFNIQLSHTAYLGSGPWTESGCYLFAWQIPFNLSRGSFYIRSTSTESVSLSSSGEFYNGMIHGRGSSSFLFTFGPCGLAPKRD